MKPNKLVAVLVLVALPHSSFAQVLPSDSHLGEMRARIARLSILDTWEFAAEPGELAVPPSACDESTVRGEEAAKRRHSSWGWLYGGIVTGPFGLVGLPIAAAFSNDKPKSTTIDVDQACYADGYRSQAKRKNIRFAVTGGLIGTAIWWLVALGYAYGKAYGSMFTAAVPSSVQ